MPRDTFKTTYEATKDSSVAGVDVAGFFSTCDYCQPCQDSEGKMVGTGPVSYTHLRAHET